MNTSPPVVTGTAQRGSILAASSGTWTGSTGAFSYQWQRCDPTGTTCLDLSGETDTSYVPNYGDLHETIVVVVTASAGASTAKARSAVTTAVVDGPPAGPPSLYSEAPSLRGTAAVGMDLVAISGEYQELPFVTWQWMRCNPSGASCVAIPGATTVTYHVTNSDVGTTIRARLTGTNAAGSITLDSPQSRVVVLQPAGARTFGALGVASLGSTSLSSATIVGTGFQLVETGTTAQFSFYGKGPDSGSQSFVPAVYRTDASGNPTTLAVTGSTITVGPGQGWGWIIGSLPAVLARAGELCARAARRQRFRGQCRLRSRLRRRLQPSQRELHRAGVFVGQRVDGGPAVVVLARVPAVEPDASSRPRQHGGAGADRQRPAGQ